MEYNAMGPVGSFKQLSLSMALRYSLYPDDSGTHSCANSCINDSASRCADICAPSPADCLVDSCFDALAI